MSNIHGNTALYTVITNLAWNYVIHWTNVYIVVRMINSVCNIHFTKCNNMNIVHAMTKSVSDNKANICLKGDIVFSRCAIALFSFHSKIPLSRVSHSNVLCILALSYYVFPLYCHVFSHSTMNCLVFFIQASFVFSFHFPAYTSNPPFQGPVFLNHSLYFVFWFRYLTVLHAFFWSYIFAWGLD